MWREMRDRAHWLDIASSEFDDMVHFIRTWSREEDEAKREEKEMLRVLSEGSAQRGELQRQWYTVGSESMVLQCGKVIEFVSEGGISVCGWFAAVADAIVGFTVGV